MHPFKAKFGQVEAMEHKQQQSTSSASHEIPVLQDVPLSTWVLLVDQAKTMLATEVVKGESGRRNITRENDTKFIYYREPRLFHKITSSCIFLSIVRKTNSPNARYILDVSQ